MLGPRQVRLALGQDALMKVSRFDISFNGYDVKYEKLEFFTEHGVQNMRLYLHNGHSLTVSLTDYHHLDIPVDKSQLAQIKAIAAQPEVGVLQA